MKLNKFNKFNKLNKFNKFNKLNKFNKSLMKIKIFIEEAYFKMFLIVNIVMIYILLEE